MGKIALNWAKKQRGPTSQARFVLWALADIADIQHHAWPSLRTLQQQTGLSERSLRRCLRELEELRLIVSSSRHYPNGRRAPNSYRLMVGPVDNSPPSCGKPVDNLWISEGGPGQSDRGDPARVTGSNKEDPLEGIRSKKKDNVILIGSDSGEPRRFQEKKADHFESSLERIREIRKRTKT